MNEKITFQQLAEHLSSLTGGSQATTETFIRELFAVVSEALSRGENVKIKNIGTFSPSGIPEQPVLFAPDKELAATINLPFSCFEPIELDDDIDENIFIDMPTDNEVENQDGAFSEKIPVATINETDKPENDINEASNSIQVIDDFSEENNSEQSMMIENNCVIEESNPDTIINDENFDMTENITTDDCVTSSGNDSVGHNHHCILVIVISLLIGLIAGYIVGNIYPIWPAKEQLAHNGEPELLSDEINVIIKDTTDSNIILPATSTSLQIPKKELVTDTIGTTRFLTTMARKYYGEMIFWVYIYEENKEKLDNPNRIKPGTVVVIPDAEKYDINKNDSTCIAKAKLKAIEIYAPYQK